MQGDLDRAMPGEADGQAFLSRFDAAVQRVAAQHGPDDTVAVVSHGAAIRVWTGLRAVGLGAQAAGEREIRNTGMAALEGDPDAGWRLASWSSEPLGGVELEDVAAHDVTGERVDEAASKG
jgi:probable phosphoglycerate mutase